MCECTKTQINVQYGISLSVSIERPDDFAELYRFFWEIINI